MRIVHEVKTFVNARPKGLAIIVLIEQNVWEFEDEQGNTLVFIDKICEYVAPGAGVGFSTAEKSTPTNERAAKAA